MSKKNLLRVASSLSLFLLFIGMCGATFSFIDGYGYRYSVNSSIFLIASTSLFSSEVIGACALFVFALIAVLVSITKALKSVAEKKDFSLGGCLVTLVLSVFFSLLGSILLLVSGKFGVGPGFVLMIFSWFLSIVLFLISCFSSNETVELKVPKVSFRVSFEESEKDKAAEKEESGE